MPRVTHDPMTITCAHRQLTDSPVYTLTHITWVFKDFKETCDPSMSVFTALHQTHTHTGTHTQYFTHRLYHPQPWQHSSGPEARGRASGCPELQPLHQRLQSYPGRYPDAPWTGWTDLPMPQHSIGQSPGTSSEQRARRENVRDNYLVNSSKWKSKCTFFQLADYYLDQIEQMRCLLSSSYPKCDAVMKPSIFTVQKSFSKLQASTSI